MADLSPYLSGSNQEYVTAEILVGEFSVGTIGTKINVTPTFDIQSFTLILESYNATSSNARITVQVGGRTVVDNAGVSDLLWAGRTHPLTLIGGKGENITVTCTTANAGHTISYTLMRGGYQ